jgi:hypothetical protein
MNILHYINLLRDLGFFAVINTRLPYRVTITPFDNPDATFGPVCNDDLDEAMIQALKLARNAIEIQGLPETVPASDD